MRTTDVRGSGPAGVGEIALLLDKAQDSGGSWQELALRRCNDIRREIDERRAWLEKLDFSLARACSQLVECPCVAGCPLMVTSEN